MDKYFPALVTLIVGIGTIIVNIFVSRKLLNFNKETLVKQLENQLRIKQIEIKSANNIKNRHDWMNQFRDTSSEYISCLSTLYVKINDNSITLAKLMYLNSKLQLLLHPEREFEEEALKLFGKLTETVFLRFDKSATEVVKIVQDDHKRLIVLCRNILDKNWQKINNNE
ncbi:MAG: hypothetical protein IM600_15980 [Bacteroidetes bacterium]|nr:hypothetical protein [Bacteroidota bacterium]MCA6444928.1 hypothetical protein [Bacteroidota bacterium]